MGGFLLHETSDEAAALFPPDIAIAYFDRPDGLVAAVRHWLAQSDGVRARIAAEGQRRALAWTYREWAARLLDLTGLTSPTG